MLKYHIKIITFIIFFFITTTQASGAISLTQEEQIFLQEHPVIVLGAAEGWAPYVIKNDDGSITGYNANVLKLINEISGANFILKLDAWASVMEDAKERRIDGLSTAVANDELRKYHNFSKSYLTLEKIIFTTKDNPDQFTTLSDLKGKKFGVHKSNILSHSIAKTIPEVEIVEFENTNKLIEGVTTGIADVMLGNAAMFYLLNKMGNPFLKPSFFLHDKPLNFVFAIRNDFPEAVTIINKSLEAIGQEKLLKLKRRWFENPYQLSNDPKPVLEFTNIEKEYLKQKQEITMCIDPAWMPFEKFENGKHVGMTAEFFEIFQKDIGIPINVIKTDTWAQTIEFSKTRKCDILSFAMETEDRVKYLNFTTPYFNTPLVLATKPNVPFFDDAKRLNTEKIGIVKGYAYNEILRKKYPNINIIDVASNEIGLQKVANGEHFGFIDTLATIGYMFQTQFTGELKIAGKFDENWELGVGVRNDDLLLLSIFNKVIQKISPEKKQDIFNKYIGIEYEKEFDYSLFWKLLITLFFLASILAYRYFIILNYNKKIKKYLNMIDDNVLISSLDSNGIVLDVSDALCKLSGYTKTELIGKNCTIFRHTDMGAMSFGDILNSLSNNNQWIGETKNIKKDGSYYWANAQINPTFDKNGNIKGYNVIHQDISDKKKLEKISITDSLTQVSNRLHLDNSYKIESQRAERYNNVFSIILMDIDLFKDINDSHGHKVGDTVLIQIALLLKQSIRSVDILGRWGGEEFLIICPETDINRAEIFAEKIRKTIENYNFPIVGKITCSFGVSEYHPNAEKDDTFQRTDEALYKAKHSGRNSVEAIN